MKKIFLVFFLLFSLFSFSQRINEYEYVVIPEKFQFQRAPQEYQLNKLLKCQLEEYGFKAFYSSELVNLRPEDRCLFLNANVINVSNIFMFRVMIEFTDCNNAIVYQAEIGGSKEKDRHDAFNEALDGSLKTVKLAKYNFEGIPSDLVFLDDQGQVANVDAAKVKLENSKVEQSKGDLGRANQAVNTQTKVKQNSVAQVTPVVSSTSTSQTSTDKGANNSTSVTQVTASVAAPVKVEPTKTAEVKVFASTSVSKSEAVNAEKKYSFEGVLLYAQAIANGFQLVDTTPKIILKLEKTLQHNYFTADKKNGVVYMKNGGWVFEYFLDGELIVEKLNVKFCD